MNFLHSVRKKVFFADRIHEHTLPIFTAILLLTVMTRLVFAYSDPSEKVIPPELLFTGFVGLDFMIGVMNPAILMANGQQFYTDVQTYGPAASITLLPLLHGASLLGVCSGQDLFSCGLLMYRMLLILTCLGFLVFTFVVGRQSKHVSILILYLITFILSVPGSLGIQRGNPDILFALITGWLLLMVQQDIRSHSGSIRRSLLIGVLNGFLVATKVFLLPYALLSIVFTRKQWLTAGVSIAVFLFYTLLPNAFGIPSTPWDSILLAFRSDRNVPLANPGYLGFNHTLAATASLLTSCVEKHSCDYFKEDATVIQTLRILLGALVFVVPFISTRWINRTYNLRTLFPYIRRMRSTHAGKSALFLLGISVSYAAMNLLPNAVFLYRLYYALPIMFVLFGSAKEKLSLYPSLLLAMGFLLLKGQWYPYIIHPHGFTLNDPRAMNVFVIFHAFFLIRYARTVTDTATTEEEQSVLRKKLR